MLRKSFWRWAPAFTPILMPSLSPSMEKGRIVEWKKRPGDAVKEGDVWCTIETDKAVVEFTNTLETGFLAKTLANSGDQVQVGSMIAVIVEEAADVANADQFTVPPLSSSAPPSSAATTTLVTPSPSNGTSSSSSSSPSTPVSEEVLRRSGPSVSRIVATLRDRSALATVTPSGKGGRFVKADFHHLDAFHYDDPAAAGRPATVASEASAPTSNSSQPREQGRSNASTPTLSSNHVAVRPTAVVDFAVSDTKIMLQLLSNRYGR